MRGEPRILGTAGHIDHGKTALVAAVTGVETDRLPEERTRGISIDLGFAPLDLGPAAPPVGIVDVPGHEGFIRNMVAGATGMDAVLLTVAADEGMMPQTREHLLVLAALGVRRGVVAVTKADLVEPEWAELVVETVREELSGSALAGAPIVVVSARTGAGLDRLRSELAGMLRETPPRPADAPFRLPVDRAFSLAGAGRVVTGTVWGGALAAGEAVAVLPGGGRCRVRSIEIHGAPADRAPAGRRVALALAGAPSEALVRGAMIVEADRSWRAVRRLDGELWLARTAPRPVASGDRVRVHHGTAEVMARVHWWTETAVEPGRGGVARLLLEGPVVPAAGDRLVLRAYSPVTTIGGGTVIAWGGGRTGRRDRAARAERLTARAAAAPPDRVRLALEDSGAAGVDAAALPIVTGLGAAALDAALAAAGPAVERHGERWFARTVREEREALLLGALEAYHTARPLLPGMPLAAARGALGRSDPALVEAVIEGLLGRGEVVRRGTALAVRGYAVELGEEDARRVAAIRRRYREAGLEAPDTDELAAGTDVPVADLRALQRHLEREGELIKLASDWYVDADALTQARARLLERLARSGPADVGTCKDLFGVSRKYLIPLLEHFDRSGITRRQGNVRVAGPGSAP